MINKIGFIVMILIMATTLNANTKKTYYKNGNLKFIKNYKNNILEGRARAYYKNGHLKTVTSFRNGKLHGMTTGYYNSGKLKAEIPMYKGKTDGFEKIFYESGQLQSITKYNNGVKIDTKKVYYPNGIPVMDETNHPVTIPKGRKAKSGTYFGILENLKKYAPRLAEAV